ncbi:c-type cytochrome [Guyparkeria sp.]|uniref:c-type cytochrome n=1 Tax=Guyparkeria sp. TaxID=2035736 RepID=UPI00356ACA24
MSQSHAAATRRRLPNTILAAIGLGMCLSASPVLADEHQSAGAMGSTIGYTCMGCHGVAGEGSGNIPRLAGVPQEAIAGMMLAYKSDGQAGTVMNRIAKGYSDEEIQAVAEFFANQ